MAIFKLITTAPTPPTRNDPDNFRTRADAFVDWQANDLVPELNDVLATMNDALDDRWHGTSSSEHTIGAGSKTFTVNETLLFFGVGLPVRVADAANPSVNYMGGTVTAYDGAAYSLTVLIADTEGSGIISNWSITPAVAPQDSRVRLWSALTGAAAPPLIVAHGSSHWSLDAYVADVTAVEPGVDAGWTEINNPDAATQNEAEAGTETGTRLWSPERIFQAARPAQKWTAISGATTLAVWRRYLVDTSGGAFTVTLPASPAAGDYVWITDMAGALEDKPLTVARNGNRIMGLEEDMTVDVQYASFALVYSDATNGWRIA